MKIIKVIVDELPKVCEECHAYDYYDGPMCGLIQYQRADHDPYIWECNYSKGRCPGCPLALEHDNAKVTKEEE